MPATVAFFVYSESASMTQTTNANQEVDTRLNVVGPAHVLQPTFTPSLFSFAITASVFNFDFKSDHEIRLTFHFDPNEPSIADTGVLPLQAFPEIPTTLPPELRGATFSIDFRNVPLRSNGIYHTKFLFDGVLIGTYPIHVWGKE
ncbi:DUF6941 family protein [Cohnella soli]|uniref:DUF6941 family protein n=1 Tax=Cohnella soli TaxID=425005 RepID=A0ABW0I234_9BACL